MCGTIKPGGSINRRLQAFRVCVVALGLTTTTTASQMALPPVACGWAFTYVALLFTLTFCLLAPRRKNALMLRSEVPYVLIFLA